MMSIVYALFVMFTVVVSAQTLPEWTWATSGGGTSLDEGNAITNDGAGNTYVAGGFRYSITFGDITLSDYGSQNLFVVKYSASGTLIWVRAVPGGYGMGVGADNLGNVLVAGYFNGTSTFGDYELVSSATDIFVAKMDSAGNWLWAVKGGSTQNDYCNGLAVDQDGNAYIVGEFKGTATFGSHSITATGGTDVFVAQVTTGGTWAWAIKGGGSSDDYGKGIAVRGGFCYITGNSKGGSFGTTTLPFTSNTYTLIARVTVNGSWIWATKAGGSHPNYGNAVCVDANGHSYVVGDFYGTASFSGISVSVTGSYRNGFLAACSPQGLWYSVDSMGAEGLMMPMAITADNYGHRYVAGYYQHSPTLGSFTLPNATSNDIFLAKLSNTGQWDWVSMAGGNSYDRTNSISLDGNGHCYVTGYFTGTASFGNYQITGPGNNDVFIARHGGVPLYLAPPEPYIEVLGTTVRVSWSPVASATIYYIYASSVPDPGDWGDPIGQTSGTYFDDPTDQKKFYRVVAAN